MAIVSTELLHDALRSLPSVAPDSDGHEAVVSRIEVQRCGFESSYGTYTVTLSFRGRADLTVFLKDYGTFERPKDGFELRRERERYVYSTLLDAAELGTARLYGSIWDHPRSRYWLFLEFVEGTALKFSDFEHWLQAAAWLGRVHGYFGRCAEQVQQADLLIAHDARFFLSTAERALCSVAELAPARASALERVLERYDPLVTLMVGQPRTLVHGAYRPTQILVNATRQPPRICPVDWELAAIGSSHYDLAYLADGFQSPRLERVLEAYRQEAVRYGIAVPATDELKHIVNCFRLHMVFSWLSKAVERQYPAATVTRLIELAHQVAATVVET